MGGSLVRAQLLLTFFAVAATGCSRNYASLSPSQVCASDQSLGRIKHAMFEQAAAEASSQTRYAMDVLGPEVQAKLSRPLVEGYDHDTRKTTCTADLDVWLPVGVAPPRELKSAIHYDSQPTADGRDVAFNVSGLEQVAAGIAGANLAAWADAHAPQKPGLIVEVVPRASGASIPAEGSTRLAGLDRAKILAPAIPQGSAAAAASRVAASQTPSAERRVNGRMAALAEVAPAESGGGPVRVFVHVSDPAALPAADRIRTQLATLDIAGAPVATPPVRMVADMPGRTEVRCLKHADCPAARRVAAYLAQQLGVSVAVVDMSRTYENDAGVRPGSLELWLRQPRPTPAGQDVAEP